MNICNCQECVNFKQVVSSEEVVFKGRDKVKIRIDCGEYGIIEIISVNTIPWKYCLKYEEKKKIRTIEAKYEINKEIGQRIRGVRKHLGLTQEKLGKATKTKRSMICLVERGKFAPRLRLLKTLCIDFKVDMNYLFTGEGPMFREGES